MVCMPALLAQTASTGALSGTVTDPSRALIPNVTVTLTSADTGAVRNTTTGADGTYKFGLLQPGNYTGAVGGRAVLADFPFAY